MTAFQLQAKGCVDLAFLLKPRHPQVTPRRFMGLMPMSSTLKISPD